ncbi:TetR family transcriptional regulator C-terminal domain-containing protein [Roseicyclus persicicus]|uniref:TetR family transcriptional regulator n=1 Tax=Roseicyclus persicicus TaxID=2650661 RepID=A0A7X6GZR3_9RHOB|nr:TetR family transcriptional regulator C-terminal domain-containing protein [Roseibacterium persicicum]NKX45346.1 TetR family transcriptional regulator [Roseibacterium persicicum]
MPDTASDAEPRPRKERAENAARRREQLVDAALRSIVRNGLPGTTLATVAREAGLSQGAAVFYFQSKEGLLAAALQRHYERYEANWRGALAEAGDDPALRLAALVRADFQPQVCAREAQIVWHAFWGEASARPLFNEIADRFDSARSDAMTAATEALLADLGRDTGQARALAAGIEGLTDGLWLQMYLASGVQEAGEARAITGHFLAALFPERTATFLAMAEG